MKKTTLGLFAIGSLLFAGQGLMNAAPSQATLLDAINNANYAGPIWFDITGVSLSVNNQAQTGQNTTAVLKVTAIGTDQYYNNTLNFNDYMYIVVTGLSNVGIPDLTTTHINLQGGVFNLYESAVSLGNPDVLVSNLASFVGVNNTLSGHFQPGIVNDATTTIFDNILLNNANGIEGTGNGYASVDLDASKPLSAKLDSDYYHPAYSLDPADFVFSFNFNPFNGPNFSGKSSITDPIRARVPEPATMLLLGTGLIGLAGIGRRKERE